MTEPPRHYARLKKLNARGAPIKGDLPFISPPLPEEFRKKSEEGAVVIDARSMLAFGGGHIPGAINMGIGAQLPNWVGWIIESDRSILLVVEKTSEIATAAAHLFRLGYGNIAGYLFNGMTSWQNAEMPLQRLQQWTVQEFEQRRRDPAVVVLDVRSDGEVCGGFIPDAQHIYLPHVEAEISKLDRSKTIATYCGTGYRASIAASILQKNCCRACGRKLPACARGHFSRYRVHALPKAWQYIPV